MSQSKTAGNIALMVMGLVRDLPFEPGHAAQVEQMHGYEIELGTARKSSMRRHVSDVR